MLHCAYPVLQLRCFHVLQWHTAYSKFHECLSGGYNSLWGISRSLGIPKINTLSFLGKTAEKQISCYPAIFTYSLHYTDPTLRDVYREIIAVCFQNLMKVTVYGLKAKFLNVTAGGTWTTLCALTSSRYNVSSVIRSSGKKLPWGKLSARTVLHSLLQTCVTKRESSRKTSARNSFSYVHV